MRLSPLGPLTNLLRLPKEALRERKAARITVNARRVQRKTYGSPENGRLDGTSRMDLHLRSRSGLSEDSP